MAISVWAAGGLPLSRVFPLSLLRWGHIQQRGAIGLSEQNAKYRSTTPSEPSYPRTSLTDIISAPSKPSPTAPVPASNILVVPLNVPSVCVALRYENIIQFMPVNHWHKLNNIMTCWPVYLSLNPCSAHFPRSFLQRLKISDRPGTYFTCLSQMIATRRVQDPISTLIQTRLACILDPNRVRKY